MNKPSKNTRTTSLDVQAIRRHILATMGVGLWVSRESTLQQNSWQSRFGTPASEQGKPATPPPKLTKPLMPASNDNEADTQVLANPPCKKQDGAATHANCLPILANISVNTDKYHLVSLCCGDVLLIADWQRLLDDPDTTQQQGWLRLVEHFARHYGVMPIDIAMDQTGLSGGSSPRQRKLLLTLMLQSHYQNVLNDCRLMLLTPTAGIDWADLLTRQIKNPTLSQLYGNPALIDKFLVR